MAIRTAANGFAANGVAGSDGRELFEREWVAKDRRAKGGDGLGPMFNDVSCKACHSQSGSGGGGPNEKNVVLLSLPTAGVIAGDFSDPKFKKQWEDRGLAAKFAPLHPAFRFRTSVLMHRHSTTPGYEEWFSDRYHKHEFDQLLQASPIALQGSRSDWHSLGEKLRRDAYKISSEVVVDKQRLRVTERNSTALFGAGLLDAVPNDVIEAAANATHDKWPKVKGRVLHHEDGSIGRFGWKGQMTSLKEFIQTACAAEIGLQVPGIDQGVDVMMAIEPNKVETMPEIRNALEFEHYRHQVAAQQAEIQKRATAAQKRPKLDMSQRDLDALVGFVGNLPRPATRASHSEAETQHVEQGRKLFEQVGCAACHLPKLGNLEGAYTDLLVHQLGQELNDNGACNGGQTSSVQSQAAAAEWRTPPLWGVRDSAPYLHDGRAKTIEQAIAFHEGTAAPSSLAYLSLPSDDRQKILDFLDTLVAPEQTKAALEANARSE